MKTRLFAITGVFLLTTLTIGIASAATGELPLIQATVTPGSTPCVTSSLTPTPELTATTTSTALRIKGNLKAATRIANAFCVSAEEVKDLHAQGLGYGEIGIAYALAEASGLSVDELIALHQSGQGWGKIAHDLGYQVHGGGANANVRPWKHADSSATPAPEETSITNTQTPQNDTKPGNGQGGGNGNGGDNGGGNGNGNGHDNGGGNGNGNGNGNGKGGKP
jgi:hypothetical protein